MSGGLGRRPGGSSAVQNSQTGGAAGSPGKRTLTEQMGRPAANLAGAGGGHLAACVEVGTQRHDATLQQRAAASDPLDTPPQHDEDKHAAHAVGTARGRAFMLDPDHDTDGVYDYSPGGNDARGKKENKLANWFDEMVEVARRLKPKFKKLELHFRPEILLATAMTEADNKHPLMTESFDHGLGLMQITPYQGKLDRPVAKALNWDNSKSLEYNIEHSKWRDAKANLMAGARTMLFKARELKRGIRKDIWDQMDQSQRWRAVMFAYNAGQGAAIAAFNEEGADAEPTSTFTDDTGEVQPINYLGKWQPNRKYVSSHNPFKQAVGREGANEDEDD